MYQLTHMSTYMHTCVHTCMHRTLVEVLKAVDSFQSHLAHVFNNLVLYHLLSVTTRVCVTSTTLTSVSGWPTLMDCQWSGLKVVWHCLGSVDVVCARLHRESQEHKMSETVLYLLLNIRCQLMYCCRVFSSVCIIIKFGDVISIDSESTGCHLATTTCRC